jgi:hypothetical protein
MRRISMIITAALVAVAPLTVVPSATAQVNNPVVMPDGTMRYDIAAALATDTSKLLIGNYGNDTVKVEYSDPAYGTRSALLAPDGYVAICGDVSYLASSKLLVTYYPGTPDEVTGIGSYVTFTNTLPATPQQAQHALTKAKRALKKAQRHHYSKARIRKAQRRVRTARRELSSVRSQLQFCEARKLK